MEQLLNLFYVCFAYINQSIYFRDIFPRPFYLSEYKVLTAQLVNTKLC